MNQFHLAIYDGPGGALLSDHTDRASDLRLSTNEHGFEAISYAVPMTISEAFHFYDQPGLPHVVVSDSAGTVICEGRLEDPGVRADETSAALTAQSLGYWRALTDTLYTALWSTTSVAAWEPSLETDLATRSPKMYVLDTNNRLFIGLTKNSTYGNVANIGGLTLETPDSSSRDFIGFLFSAVINLPTNWKFEVYIRNRNFTNIASLLIFTGTGASNNRAWFLTFAAGARLEVVIYNQTGANYTFAGENGANYVRLTQIRAVSTTANIVNTTLTTNRAAGASVTATVGSTARMYAGMQLVVNTGANPSEIITVESVTNATQFVSTFVGAYVIGNAVQGFVIYADEIASDLIAATDTVNPTQISSNTALIQSPGLDLTDEVYEDALPADILTRLARLGDNQATPRIWETGVYEGRMLFFRPQGSVARTWYVDAADLEVVRTIDQLDNSFYAVYTDANGRDVRTAVNADTASVARYELTRRAAVRSRTTSATQAQAQRDAALNDQSDPTPRTRLRFTALYDAAGARWPNYYARAGDTFVIRNLPPQLSTAIDRIRVFRVIRTEYQASADAITVTPESQPATLSFLIARLSAGLQPPARPGIRTPAGVGGRQVIDS
jgi:hypothetical protein